MIRQSVTSAAVVLIAAASAAASAAEVPDRFVTHFLKAVGADGENVGEYLRGYDNASTPPSEVGLLETGEGYRAHLRWALDRDKGTATSRFLDLHSGWWIELRADLGLRNLGGPEDFYDSMDWVVALNERTKRERPTTTYTLMTSDGAHSEWSEPWKFPEDEAQEVRTGALAGFAADLVQAEVPPSAVAELELLAALLESPHRGKVDTFDELIEHAVLVLRAVRGTGFEPPQDLDVHTNVAQPERVNRLMKAFDADERGRNEEPERRENAGGG
jgi:hypothetical protein